MHAVPYWRLSSYYFAYFAFIGVFSPYFGLYLQALSFSAWDIGLLMSQMQLMRLFGPYLWGALADRLGRHLLIVRLTGLLALISFSLFFFVSRFDALFIAMALLAFFWVASLPLVEALTFDHLHDNPARYSRIRLWGSIGYIAAVLGTGALLDHLPLSALLWASVASLVGIVLCSLMVPAPPVHQSLSTALPVRRILRQKYVLALFAACFIMYAAHATLNIFFSIYLAEHGYAKSLIGALFSIGVVAEIAVFILMPRIMRRFGLRVLLQVCFGVAALRFILIGWGVDFTMVLVLAQLMHGITFGAFHAASIAAVNRWFPGPARARGQAIYSSVSFGAGGLAGGLLSGLTWDPLGGALTFTLGSLFALAGVLIVARWIKGRDGERGENSVVDSNHLN